MVSNQDGNFLSACTAMENALLAVYGVMSTMKVRVDEREILFTAQNVYILKGMSCLEPTFMESFLRPSDKPIF